MRYTLILLSFLAVSCSTSKQISYMRTGEVEFLSSEKNTITVSSKSVANTSDKAIYYAEINAIENILFKGIPNSNQESPLLANESEAWRLHNDELQKLIYKEGYRLYVMDSKNISLNTYKGASSAQQEVKFDLHSLRRHLTEVGVIKKFGI